MRLIILGAGEFGKTIEDVAGQLDKYEKINFLDDKAEGEDILGKTDDFKNFINDYTEFYPAFGDNELRYNWILKLDEAGAKIATIVHPSAYVSPKVVIGKGSAGQYQLWRCDHIRLHRQYGSNHRPQSTSWQWCPCLPRSSCEG